MLFVPGSLDGLVNLEHLDVMANSPSKLFAFPPGIFRDNRRLRSLYLMNNKFITTTDVDGVPASFFQGMELDFKGWELNFLALNHLWTESCDIRDLTGLLDGLFNLTKLDLSYNPFDSLGNSPFKDLKQLRELDIELSEIDKFDEKSFLGLEEPLDRLCYLEGLPDSALREGSDSRRWADNFWISSGRPPCAENAQDRMFYDSN